jgi:Tol biopolymer transport system component
MSKKKIFIIALFLIYGVTPPRAAAQTKAIAKNSLDPIIDLLFAVRHFKQVAISPDGTRVVWVQKLIGRNGAPSGNSAIYLADLQNLAGLPRRITAGEETAAHDEQDVAWSPDGTRIAFLSDAETGGQLQLYQVNIAGGPPQRLTNLAGFLANPRWSPDGKTMALLFTENAPRAAGPLEPMTPDTGVVEGHIYEQRLTTVDVATGNVRHLSPADLYVYEYDWSPDSKNLAATAAHGSGDDNWYVAELYIISLASGQTKSIY